MHPSPYARQAALQVERLVLLFRQRAHDQLTMDRLGQMAATYRSWKGAQNLFNEVRTLYLDCDDIHLLTEYEFVEACLQTLYNETYPNDPFDSISPFFVLKSTIGLAQQTGIELAEIDAVLRGEPPAFSSLGSLAPR